MREHPVRFYEGLRLKRRGLLTFLQSLRGFASGSELTRETGVTLAHFYLARQDMVPRRTGTSPCSDHVLS